ncbi:hypothetical protein B0H12DRAFT_586312 [Mycena haematopus]|nr:hypothetical protein B0H12DRAFT_586312 [Mycena haematopus]
MHSHSQSLSFPQASETNPPAQKRRRCRTLSVSIPLAGSVSKIIVAAPSSASKSAAQAAAGAFTLTGCARAALLGLVLGTSDEPDANEDSYDDREYTPVHTRTCSTFSDKDVPSISRTASPFEGERAPIPPGWGARPRGGGVKTRRRERERSQSRERSQHGEQSASRRATRIHPVLRDLERASLVGTGHVVCAACGTSGVNFPRCTRCAKMWCSRACRTSAVHRCPPRRSQTT